MSSFADKSLIGRLNRLADSDLYPFHMPGHKRNPSFAEALPSAYRIDITEIKGFDNLHHPTGILRDAMARAAEEAGADRTWFLVNGSTCGIQAAIAAVVKPGEKLLLARNFHRSAGQMLTLRDIRPVFVMPEPAAGGRVCGSVDPEKIRKALRENPDVRAVFLTSPTYEGIVSDIEKIAEITHARGIPLIVDEAHGAHFLFDREHREFPQSALQLGADLVIQSLHKTLPALTQTAVLYLKGNLVDPDEIFRNLRIFETSSPSYVLMASIDQCFRYMNGPGSGKLMDLAGNMKSFYAGLQKSLRYLYVPGRIRGSDFCFDRDISKVVIFGRGYITGTEIADKLRQAFHLEPEMACRDYVICMTTLMDSQEGLNRLYEAILAIDREISERYGESASPVNPPDPEDFGNPGDTGAAEFGNSWFSETTRLLLPPEKASDGEKELLPLDRAGGKIAADFVTVYPPGVPMVIPGEEITEKMMEKIRVCLKLGLEVDGIEPGSSGNKGKIWTVKG